MSWHVTDLTEQQQSSLADRLIIRTRKAAGGCIEWPGSAIPDGHGMIGATRKKNVYVHRVAFELFVGPIPDGLQVLHTCDNPPCVNPIHLFLGTNADNHKDKVSKGRQSRGKMHGLPRLGSLHANSKLTEAVVLEIRRRWAAGGISQGDLAAEYVVHKTLISKVVLRKIWTHV